MNIWSRCHNPHHCIYAQYGLVVGCSVFYKECLKCFNVCGYVGMGVGTDTHMYVQHTHTHRHTHTHTHTQAQTRASTHTHTHTTHTHTHKHKRAHTRTHTRTRAHSNTQPLYTMCFLLMVFSILRFLQRSMDVHVPTLPQSRCVHHHMSHS